MDPGLRNAEPQGLLKVPPSGSDPSTAPTFLQKPVDFLLTIEPLLVVAGVACVYFSYLLGLGAALPWLGLALAFIPFPLRRIYRGRLRLRTPFDVPAVILLVGSIVGLIVSEDTSLSLGAFQCILGLLLFYYSWVNRPRLASMMKWLIVLVLLSVLMIAFFARFGTPFVSSDSPFAIAGGGTGHGVALCLVIAASVLLGIAVFWRGRGLRLAAIGISVSLCTIVFFMTKESLKSLLSLHSFTGRTPVWGETVSLLGDSPFTGLGLGSWALDHNLYELTSQYTAHNAFLELYANTGILGVLALCLSLFIAFKLASDIVRSPRNHPWYGFGMGVLVACLATLLVGVVESSPAGVTLVDCGYVVSPAPLVLFGCLVCAHKLICQPGE